MPDNLVNLFPGVDSSNAAVTQAPGSLLYLHPEYVKRWWWREFGRVSYLGGREYARPTRLQIEFQEPILIANDKVTAASGQMPNATIVSDISTIVYNTMLFRHSREKKWEYYNRQKRAYYYNFVRTIVNALVSHATERDANREGDALLTEFWAGVDCERQQNIGAFMRHGLRWAQVMDMMWCCVDVDKEDGDGKPYAYWVSPQDILDWETDADGEIVWLKQFCYVEQPRKWNEKITPRFRFRIWSQDGVETYETDAQGGGKVPVPDMTRAYDLGRVPFVPLFSLCDEEYTFPAGTALAADLCKGANHVYNACSLLSEILYKQTFSWLAVPDKNVDSLQMGLGTAFGYDPSGTSAKPEYISPDADQARVLMEAIVSTLEQLRQSIGVGRGRQEGSMQKSSAQALELESDDKRSILSDIAGEAEAFEYRLADLVMAYRTGGSATVKPSILYGREFDLGSVRDEINDALALRNLQVSPEVNLEALQGIVRRYFAGMQPEKLSALVDTLQSVATMTPTQQPDAGPAAKPNGAAPDPARPRPTTAPQTPTPQQSPAGY